MQPLVRTILVLLPVAALSVGTAAAQVDMAWHDTGPGSINSQFFGCDTNEGVHTLVASFQAPAGVEKLVSIEAVVDFCTGAVDFPAWFELGTCRSGALSASVDFSSGPSYFEDYWDGRGSAGVTFSRLDSNRGRIVVTASLPEIEAGPLIPGLNYYAFRILIDNRQTTGDGSCAGCGTGACFVLNDVRLLGPGLDTRLNGPNFSNSPAWQNGVPGCPFIVPVQNSTWTTLKTRYN